MEAKEEEGVGEEKTTRTKKGDHMPTLPETGRT
jgi:hypothetical protein